MQLNVNVKVNVMMRTLLICLLAPAAVALAEDKPLNAFNVKAYGYLKDILIRSAEKMPEENYNFKPTEAVRSFGQILGHVADSNYFFCSMVLGEKNPSLKIEKTKSSKADLIASLKDAFTYCDKAYNGMTDASGSETVKLFGGDTRKRDVLTVNNMHTVEHYGNIVTYMRIKGMVPPSSQGQ